MIAKRRWAALALAAVLLASSAGCAAKKEEYPTKSIDFIIPWSAGGGTDVAGRLYAKALEKQLGQTVNVLNVPGGSSTVGIVQARDAKPDGYTHVLLTFDILSTDILGLGDLSYKDLKMVSTFTNQPTVLVVNASSGWKTLEDYRAAAKADPGKLKVATPGDGNVWHQAGILADTQMGTSVTYVPYNGSGEQVAALLGGHVDATYISYATVKDYLTEGSMIALGVLTDERVENIPDVPTFTELGYDVVYNSWRGIAVQKDVPDDVFEKICAAYKAAYEDPEFQEAAKQGQLDLWYLDAGQFNAFLDENHEKCAEVLKSIGMAK